MSSAVNISSRIYVGTDVELGYNLDMANRTGKGYYQVVGSERMSRRPITLKLPESVDRQVRELAGDDLAAFIRLAVAEKIQRLMEAQG